jgi:hypothetical protein
MSSRSRFGVEPFDVGYGAAYQAETESSMDVECEVVEDEGRFEIHEPVEAGIPKRLAFVDGIMNVEARLTRADPNGLIVTGIAGSWAAGAVLADVDSPLQIDAVQFGRVTIFCGGEPVSLPPQPAGWAWEALTVEDLDIDEARRRLLRRMRDIEGKIAEHLSGQGWLTVVDGPLNNVRRTTTGALVGYVKTHRRRMLAVENWVRVPELRVGQRTSMFAIGDDFCACYFRVGDAGPWASTWGGIVRLEVSSGTGRARAEKALDSAAAWLPRYASALHRDARAPVNLTPIAGLETALRRYTGNSGLVLRAIRAAILQMNAEEAA